MKNRTFVERGKNLLFMTLAICIFISCFFFCGCNSNERPLKAEIAILHAGGGYDNLTYLNAQETFDYYYDMGYRYFEYDFQLSSDGRLIGTHSWEHLETKYPSSITYEEFKALELSNDFTPANEEWLMQTIMAHPDVKFVIDAKGDSIETDVLVLQRIEALESIYNYDISSNIIPEIFSKEMWEVAKKTTSFDKYFYSQYKTYYNVSQILEYFDDERIWGIAFSTYVDGDIRSQFDKIKDAGKKIFIFTPTTTAEVVSLLNIGVNGVYVDTPSILP